MPLEIVQNVFLVRGFAPWTPYIAPAPNMGPIKPQLKLVAH